MCEYCKSFSVLIWATGSGSGTHTQVSSQALYQRARWFLRQSESVGFVFLTIFSMTLTLKIHSAAQELSSTPSPWVVTWPRPGPILLAQSEVFPGINTWRIGGRCYLLSQEWLGCGCLWLCSLPCGHNPVTWRMQSSPQSKAKTEGDESCSRRTKAPAGSTRLGSLPPFLYFWELCSPSPSESHFWVKSFEMGFCYL